MAIMQSARRPLTNSEQRLLGLRTANLESQRDRGWRVMIMGAVVVGALWLTTLVASDAPGVAITLFWTVVAAFLAGWIQLDIRREHRYIDSILKACRSAQRANQADVFDVKAKAFVEFEEVEDEGACFAFQLSDDKVVFVVGQQFYPGVKFPSLDFSLVNVLDENEQVVDAHIEKRGPQTAPARVIPAARKRDLVIPEHLEWIDAQLDHVEAALEVAHE